MLVKPLKPPGWPSSQTGHRPRKSLRSSRQLRRLEQIALVKELVLLDLEFRSRGQAARDREAYLAELPGCGQVIDEALAEYRGSESVLGTAAVNSTADNGSQPVAAPATLAAPPQPPPADAVRIGRYILLERLGVGGMGCLQSLASAAETLRGDQVDSARTYEQPGRDPAVPRRDRSGRPDRSSAHRPRLRCRRGARPIPFGLRTRRRAACLAIDRCAGPMAQSRKRATFCVKPRWGCRRSMSAGWCIAT